MNSILSNQSRAFQMSRSFANNSPVNMQSNIQDRSKLSFHLKDFMTTVVEASEIDFRGRDIQELDHTIDFSQHLEAVNLDNNQLEDLQGIQQFVKAKQISLMNNQV